ncbi:hypothetical protein E2493_14855 [Sphingomonas parva]|uniref:Glycosyltransferase RgtA/B/C/D-like domain-containing protein n=1 Tax=Sphingomonas parva TaxID=2555898 RepID=A0A4Y8ZNF1_9SPHN|nr:hypothetical protein [Sphingomonas parva]TFI57484.1 hypothetical protein E2493_14855 [Sphingomonas parva]
MNALGSELSFRQASALPRAAAIWAAVALCAALQLHLAFAQPINWDEFRFLSDVHAYRNGTLASPVQTFHVHLFGWLAGAFGSEIDEVIAGRLAMLAIEWGTAALLFRISRAFAGREAALFAALCFLSFSFVLKHGASFRYDPIATFLLTGAAALLLGRLRWTAAAGAGAAVALAAVVTIKAVLFLPLLGLIAVWRVAKSEDRRDTLIRLAIAGLTCACVFVSLYLAHKAALPAAGDGQAVVAASAQKTLGEGQFFPRRLDFIRSLLGNPIHWTLLGLGAAIACRRRLWIALAFALPLASLLFYRNAFPYFFAFMLAPASLLWALAAARPYTRRLLPVLAIGLVVGAVGHALAVDGDVLARQRATVAAARAIFPGSLPYIDGCSMLARSPQAGFFMSSWGIENYRAAGRPVMRDAITRGGARYIVAGNRQLSLALAGSAESRLLPQDTAVLRDDFVPHWGAIRVLGKRLPPSVTPLRFELLASGPYTVESAAAARIDGIQRRPGDVVTLAAGGHDAVAPAGLTLRWGNHLHRPAGPPPGGDLFTGF